MMGTDWTVSSPSHLLKAGWNNIWCDWGLESHVYEGCLHPSNLPRDVVRFANNDENLRRFLNIEQVNCVSNDLFVEEEEQKEILSAAEYEAWELQHRNDRHDNTAGADICRVHFASNYTPGEVFEILVDNEAKKATTRSRGWAKSQSENTGKTCTPSLFHMNFDPRNENELGGAKEELNRFSGDEQAITKLMTLLMKTQKMCCVRLPDIVLTTNAGTRLEHMHLDEVLSFKDPDMFGTSLKMNFLCTQAMVNSTSDGVYEDQFAFFQVTRIRSPEENLTSDMSVDTSFVPALMLGWSKEEDYRLWQICHDADPTEQKHWDPTSAASELGKEVSETIARAKYLQQNYQITSSSPGFKFGRLVFPTMLQQRCEVPSKTALGLWLRRRKSTEEFSGVMVVVERVSHNITTLQPHSLLQPCGLHLTLHCAL
jgi:hypothetical protein